MPFTSPNEELGIRKPSLDAIPKKPKKKGFKPGLLTFKPTIPQSKPVAPSLGGLRSAAASLGGKPFAPGSEGF